MTNSLFTRLILLAVISLTYLSCGKLIPIDQVDFTPHNAEYAFPLTDTKTSLQKLLDGFDNKALIQIGADGGLTLHYEGNYIAKNSLDLLAAFQDVIFPVTDTAFSLPYTLPNGVHLDYIDLKSGKLTYAAYSGDPSSLKMALTIPQLQKNGVPFKVNIVIPPKSLWTDSLDVTGYRLQSTNDSINVNYDARRPDGTRVILNNPSCAACGLYIRIQNFQLKFAQGYLGTNVFDIPQDTIKIAFFEKWKGNVRFVNPTMTLTLDNSFGVPIRTQTKLLQAISADGTLTNLESPLLQTGVNIAYPNLSEINQSKRTTVVLDKTNSNLPDLIAASPTAIAYKINAFTNPDGNTKTIGFLTDSSAYSLHASLDLPVYGTAKGFEVTDTFNINFSQYQKNVDHVELKIIADNGMPIDLGVQGYFATDAGTILDSLYATPNTILKAAAVDAAGSVTSSTQQISYTTIDYSRFHRIAPATKLLVHYFYSTANKGTIAVKVLATQEVRLQIGMKLGLK